MLTAMYTEYKTIYTNQLAIFAQIKTNISRTTHTDTMQRARVRYSEYSDFRFELFVFRLDSSRLTDENYFSVSDSLTEAQ